MALSDVSPALPNPVGGVTNTGSMDTIAASALACAESRWRDRNSGRLGRRYRQVVLEMRSSAIFPGEVGLRMEG